MNVRDSMESDESALWLLETHRAAQRGISDVTTVSELGEAVCESLTEVPETSGAWVARPQPQRDSLDVRCSSMELPETIEPRWDGPSPTERAVSSGEVVVMESASNPEYDEIRAETDIPAATQTVSIPLSEPELNGVVHLYVDLDSPIDPAALAELGGSIETGISKHHSEQQLEHERQRLEALRSTVSHDIGNPVNLAAGRLELAQNDIDNDHLEHVESGLRQIDTLAGDALTFVDAGAAVESRPAVELDEIVADCWETVGEERATIRTDPVTIYGDSERLRMLLNHLFENALVHNDGPVTLTVGPLPDRGFYVADDGDGIPDDERGYVFDRGYTTVPERDGHGLAIVEEIASAHGWTVSLADGEGTRVEIETALW